MSELTDSEKLLKLADWFERQRYTELHLHHNTTGMASTEILPEPTADLRRIAARLESLHKFVTELLK